MINELGVSQDIQAFQIDIALDKLSSITAQEARRNVIILNDASTDGHAVEKTLKQTSNTFMQNLNKISKNIKNEKPLHLIESSVITPSNSVELLVNILPKLKTSENIGVQNMQMEVPSIDSFTPLEAAAISCVLKECLDQLAIIGFMLPAKVDSRWDDTFKTIDETYGVPDEPTMIFREEMGLLPIIPTEAEKIQRDRNYAYQVLERVLHDIKNNGRFDSLQKEIDNITKKQEDDRNLEATAQIWLSQAEELQELLESEKKANEENRKKTIKLAQESDAQIDHAIFLNSGKLGYAQKWEKARLEQQELKLQLQRKDMLNKLSDYLKEYNAEQIISAELTAHLEEDIKEKEEQIVKWTKKYNVELVERQQEIDELKHLIEEQKLEIEEMRDLIDKQQKLIDESIVEQKRLQEEAKLNKAATIIQSIWKGYMVRHELGKYKNLLKRLRKRKKLGKKKNKLKKKRK
ncbi:dynein regulatory complex protein 9-like isoform X2 [Cataglyphis hispanica]|nr:dynein regulatory complex protein 9-like isoform X2 [Cataglyphis hispanica]